MATRSDINAELTQALAEFEAGVRALSAEELARACTDSEAPGADPWTPKDHVAHVIRVEDFFLEVARRTVAGDPDPIRFSAMGDSREEVLAAIHRQNQRHVDALRSLSLDEVLAQLAIARAATLAFIDAHDEVALAIPVPGSPWGDGTVGGMLGRNAAHEINHLKYVQEALRSAMSEDRSYVERNTEERERMRALVARLTDDELARQVNDHWTVAGVLGHVAFWDARVLALAGKVEAGVPSGAEPEDVDWINDASRPLIHAIAPRQAAELAVRLAEEADRRVASLPPDRLWPVDPASPINRLRADHRGEHLDEIEAALG
jgi:DinB superfamily/Mycothiol maleylpyruvate isomerase N-terminal domain